MGRRGGVLWGVLVFSSACPLGGYQVDDHPAPELVAELPMRCAGPIARTSTGTWVCSFEAPIQETHVGVSRGGTDFAELPGSAAAVSGPIVWTWDTVLRRFEDLDAGTLVPAPDASYDWRSGSIVPQDISCALPHEDQILLSGRGLELVTARADRLELTVTIANSFQNDSHVRSNAWAFLQVGMTAWAWGPDSGKRKFCALVFMPDGGILTGPQCNEAPTNLMGTGYSGMWMSGEAPSRIQLYRSQDGTFSAVEGTELPDLKWTAGGLPWATWPDKTTLLVPRMSGDRVAIDQYRGSGQNEWAGASEDWIWEWAAGGTRVYRR